MQGRAAHIGLTAEWVGTQAGGRESYSRALIAALGRAGTPHRFTAYTARPDALTGLPGVTARYLGTGSRAVFGGIALPVETVRRPPDLLHVTSIPPLFSRVPYVMTLHDLGHRVMPDMYPPRIRWRLDKTITLGLRRALRILCVSEATRADLLRHHPDTDPRRVDVVGEGGFLPVAADHDPAADRATLDRLGLAPGYFLFVGRLHVRKNLLTLIDAYAALPEALRRAHPLVLVGRRMYGGDEIAARIAAHGLADRVRLPGHVADADLPAVYRGARAFVYPSLFEGFGLPPLEAMSQGVPVVTADRHSLPAVVGDAGLCVDATQGAPLTQAMQRLAQDDALRADLIARGLVRARHFTWERAAAGTLQVYDKALHQIAGRRIHPAAGAAGRGSAAETSPGKLT